MSVDRRGWAEPHAQCLPAEEQEKEQEQELAVQLVVSRQRAERMEVDSKMNVAILKTQGPGCAWKSGKEKREEEEEDGEWSMERKEEGEEAVEEHELSFCDQYLGDQGCIELMRSVRTRAALVVLDLRGNSIGLEGCEAVAEALRLNRSIQVLSLEWNCIGSMDQGVRALASSLEINNCLRDLDLRNNEIGPDGGVSLARALESNIGLQKLDLRWNSLGVRGGRALAAALEQTNRTLQFLNVAGNNVNAVDAVTIDKAIRRNKSPSQDLEVGVEQLRSLAAKIRLSKADSADMTVEEVLKGAREEVQRAQLQEDQEDQAVFADRVVKLEVELGQVKETLSNRELELENTRNQLTALQAVNAALEQQVEKQRVKGEDFHSQLLSERSEANLARDRMTQLEAEIAELSQALTASKEAHESAREANARAAKHTESLKTQLEAALACAEELREERNRALDAEAQEKQAQQELRETNLRERLELENQIAQLRDNWQRRLADESAKTEREIAARAQDAKKHSAELLRARESHARELAAAREDQSEALVAQKIELDRRIEDEREQFALQTDKLTSERAEALEIARASHRAQMKDMLVKHEVETKRAVKRAVEKAVEHELASAVQVAVQKAAKEMEAEHKQALWDREKAVKHETEMKSQRAVARLEEQLVQAKSRVLELESMHKEELARLRSRMREAVTDLFDNHQ
ncbi:Leucine-rich repeat-containing protein 45 [Durusdinium trenchii]|uniref:Leucine-rich repeat-containing protein 45 n=1 Tax=Durusdinium trenchii TaxID=1381693 RepID=A0ABP0SAK8_9DINO